LKQYKHAPVEQSESSYISLLNVGAEFNGISTNDPYTSDGLGKTYGAELSLTKRFTDGYYVTATGSYVRQEFTGADGIWRFGTFDNKFIGNLLAGVEWKTSENFSIEFSTKFTYAGGAPYTPIDMDSSRYYGETRYDIKNPYSLRNKPFHRLDLRIEFKNNFNGWSLSGFFLIDNLLDVKNIERRYYRQATDSVEEIYQFGFFPVGGFRIEF
jgi:outer membrane receptor protein involved in Fe transport